MDGPKLVVAAVADTTTCCRATADVSDDPSSSKLGLGANPRASSIGLGFAFSPLLKLKQTPYGGRSLFAVQPIPAGTLLHVCAAPHAHVIYRAFRKEVCARCFAYAVGTVSSEGGGEDKKRWAWNVRWDGHVDEDCSEPQIDSHVKNGRHGTQEQAQAQKRTEKQQKQKRPQVGSGAGAPYFCSEACRDAWIVEDGGYGPALAEVVAAIERADVAARAAQAKRKGRIPSGGGGGRRAEAIVELENILANEAPEEVEELQTTTCNGTRLEATKEQLDQAWACVEAWAKAQHGRSGVSLPFVLDEEELNLARSAVSAIVLLQRESDYPSSSNITSFAASSLPAQDPDSPIAIILPTEAGAPASLTVIPPSQLGNASLAATELDFAKLLTLQDSELANVRMRPYLLRAHLRVCAFLGATLPPSLRAHVGVVRQLLARETGNAFGIWEDDQTEEKGSGDAKKAEDTRELREREMFGWGVWVSASLFNHSCAPNMRKKRSGRALEFFTSRDVKEGEELCISYINTDAPVGERREELRTSWFFECMCARCIQESG